jgi:histidine triad (HIT) family protein
MHNRTVQANPVLCIFCAIVARQAPVAMVYEDEYTLAFLDIHPANPGHTLVIPKRHARDLLDVSAEDLSHVMRTVQRVARAIDAALRPDGINLIQANRPAAFQSVFHFHVHVIPRWEGDGLKPIWRHGRATEGELRDMAKRIGEAIQARGGTELLC